jgi:hypothetical protein
MEGDQSIQWAAFYSDCEHEVKEVKTGHRITLAYRLYVHERVSRPARRSTCTSVLATNPLSSDRGAKRSHSGLKLLIPKE